MILAIIFFIIFYLLSRTNAINGIYFANPGKVRFPSCRRQAEPIEAGLLEAGYSKKKIFIADTIQDALSHVFAMSTEQPKVVLLENDLPDNY